MPSVRNGLLVIIMLISNHKSLAEQLVAANVIAVLNKCLAQSSPETMLAIIARNHISMVHKLESKGMSCDHTTVTSLADVADVAGGASEQRIGSGQIQTLVRGYSGTSGSSRSTQTHTQ